MRALAAIVARSRTEPKRSGPRIRRAARGAAVLLALSVLNLGPPRDD